MSEQNVAPSASTLTARQVEALSFLFGNATPEERKALLDVLVTEETVQSVTDIIGTTEKLFLAVLTDGDTRLLGLVGDENEADATVLTEIIDYLRERSPKPVAKKPVAKKPARKPAAKTPRKPTDRRPSTKAAPKAAPKASSTKAK